MLRCFFFSAMLLISAAVGWQPAVGLVVLCNAATFLLAGIPDSFLVWIVSAAAVIPLCVASLLTVYFQ